MSTEWKLCLIGELSQHLHSNERAQLSLKDSVWFSSYCLREICT